LIVELSVEYPKQTRVLGASFSETGDEMRGEDENTAHMGGKTGAKLLFSPKLVLRGVSPPVSDLPYLCLEFCSYSVLNQAL
jgi:hypothetical protein